RARSTRSPVYAAAPPQVIHHTTVVQPNGVSAALYPPVPQPLGHGRHALPPLGLITGTMAMSAGAVLTTPQGTPVGPQQLSTYRSGGSPGYGYLPTQW
ncbi:myelin-associated neurite-outgrowth inhibitor-like, partial [Lampetra fluviatilis]